jgi:predicted Zn-dependent protease
MPRDYTRTDFREPLSVAGGAVFVPLTLLADAPREEWFVFQIAHAMAHIASRHAARIESRMDVLATPELNGSSMDPSVAGPVFISFSRRFELDADAAAVHTMSDAGYDPSRVLPLGDPDRHESERLFSSMRVKAERRGDNLGKVVSQIPKRSYISSEAGFSEVKQAAVSRMQE